MRPARPPALDWADRPGWLHPWLWESLPSRLAWHSHQTKGGFLSRRFVLLPQSAALCMAKANSTAAGTPSPGSAGAASLLLPLSLPWLLPCSLFSLALWLARAGGSQGSPRWELRHGKGQLGQAEAAQRQGESAVAQGEGALRLRDSWERA